LTGATMVLRRKFSAHHFFEDIRKHDVTVLQYIGELCRYLLAVPPVSTVKFLSEITRYLNHIHVVFTPNMWTG